MKLNKVEPRALGLRALCMQLSALTNVIFVESSKNNWEAYIFLLAA